MCQHRTGKSRETARCETGDYRINEGLFIVDDRIKEVGPLSVVQSHAPKDAAIIDLTHFTVSPGLIDAHTHLLQNNAAGLGDEPNLLIIVTSMSTALRALLGAVMGVKIWKLGSPRCGTWAIPG